MAAAGIRSPLHVCTGLYRWLRGTSFAGSSGNRPARTHKLEAEVCGLPGRGGVCHQLLHAVPCAAKGCGEAGAEGGAAGEPEASYPKARLSMLRCSACRGMNFLVLWCEPWWSAFKSYALTVLCWRVAPNPPRGRRPMYSRCVQSSGGPSVLLFKVKKLVGSEMARRTPGKSPGLSWQWPIGPLPQSRRVH